MMDWRTRLTYLALQLKAWLSSLGLSECRHHHGHAEVDDLGRVVLRCHYCRRILD